MSKAIKTAMISSTALDLPEHRKQVIDACLRLSVMLKAMEHLPARDADAIRVSLEMVDAADIYIGIYAWRYGYIPDGYDISVTEMEFDHAVKRCIPILVFTIHKDHALTIDMVQVSDEAKEKLAALKDKATKGRGRAEFKSPEDLRAHVVHALGEELKRQQTESGETPTPQFHPTSSIPKAPETYIAHPYTLLQSKNVIGRQAELNLLTDWVTSNQKVPADVRLFNVVAIGGMGKSALTWKWFNDIAPLEMSTLAGRLWWSFYESDAHYENFIIRALAYTSGLSEQDSRSLPPPEREEQFFRCLDEQPFLLVLDGLERILLAYSRLDAAHLVDDDLDERTANRIATEHGLPDNIKKTYLEKHRLRRCADPRAGRFLRRLAQVRASRVLISTRLYPAELQSQTAQPLSGCYPLFLDGLKNDDALNLWQEFGVSGVRDELLLVFNAFGNYPLLLRALAGEVASYRHTPGDFSRWRQANPKFDPTQLDLKNAKTHVLEYALQGLDKSQWWVLVILAAFRMPVGWEMLISLFTSSIPLTKTGKEIANHNQDEKSLDCILTELEDRGLIGWDRRANRYDMHPIVRSVIWATLSIDIRRDVYSKLYGFLNIAPKFQNWQQIESLEDLTPSVELYNVLIGLEFYDEAFMVFQRHLDKATLYRLSASQQRVEWLEQLFPDGLGKPKLNRDGALGLALIALGVSYNFRGEPGRAVPIFKHSEAIDKIGNGIMILCSLSNLLRVSGSIRDSIVIAFKALSLTRKFGGRFHESVCCQSLGLSLSTSDHSSLAKITLNRSLIIWQIIEDQQGESLVHTYLAQHFLRQNQPHSSLLLASRAWELTQVNCFERDLIRAARIQGEVALGLNDLYTAEERLHHALKRTRAVHFVEEELPALTALAELHRRREDFATARDLLEQVWDAAEHGPYPLLHADARNVLTQIERDQGNTEAAIAAATRAYQLAWCDGPPYAYHFGLSNASRHLQELGAPEPDLPPFDESKYEPMPDVELNPRDEFYVDMDNLGDGL